MSVAEHKLIGFANGIRWSSGAGLQAYGPEQQNGVPQQLQEEEECRGT